MKRTITILSVTLYAFSTQAQNNTTIHADIKGLEAGKWVYCTQLVDRTHTDSVQTVAGGFTLDLAIPEGEGDAYILQIGKKYVENGMELLFFDKGHVTIQGEGPLFKDAKVSGTKALDDYNAFETFLKENPVLKGSADLYKKANELYEKKDTAAYAALKPQLMRMDSLEKAQEKQWVLQHPSSPYSAFILSFNLGRLDLDEKEAIYDKLSAAAKNNAPAKRIAHTIKVNNLTGIGKTAMDFTQNDTAGKPVSLKDFRGKYVLVDFWASWCVPCRGENPNVVKAYKDYHDKNFTVLSVSLDQPNGKEKWLKAIHDDGLTWTQVSDLKWWNNAVAKQYDIQSIPTNLLISPEGKIIAKDLHGEELEKKLSELLGPPAASSFLLKGKITGLDKGFAYLSHWGDGKPSLDSAALENGSFQIKGAIDNPLMMTFYVKVTPGSQPGRKDYVDLFLEPASMELHADYGNIPAAQLSGSAAQLEYEEYERQIKKLEKRWTVVMDTLTAANKRSNFEYQALRDWVLLPYFQEYTEIGTDFVNAHPSSWFAAYLVNGPLQRDLSDDTLKKIYAAFPQPLQKSSYGKAVLAELENRKKGVPGAIAASFSSTDINGKSIMLENYKGKYVLLDFWASWCLPCRKEGPHLKELYSRYKTKGLEIIGVASDDRTPDAWKKAVSQDGLPWLHILDGMTITKDGGYDRSTSLSEKYNVSELPTQILIDPNGKIIGRFQEESFGRGALDKQLSGLW